MLDIGACVFVCIFGNLIVSFCLLQFRDTLYVWGGLGSSASVLEDAWKLQKIEGPWQPAYSLTSDLNHWGASVASDGTSMVVQSGGMASFLPTSNVFVLCGAESELQVSATLEAPSAFETRVSHVSAMENRNATHTRVVSIPNLSCRREGKA
jgi:hypothetical protein